MSAFFEEVGGLAEIVRVRRPGPKPSSEAWSAYAERMERFAMRLEAAVLVAEAAEIPQTAEPERVENALGIIRNAALLHEQANRIANLAWARAARAGGVWA